MAITEVYIDPFLAADSGAGTSGDPYGDLEYALEQVTRDATNGDRFNIKAGTDEILEFALDIVVDYGTPTSAAPLIFQGYTTTAGDGGGSIAASTQAGISGGASVSICNLAAIDYVHFVDLHLHNTGANVLLTIDDYCSIIRCELDNCSSGGIIIGSFSLVADNYIHNVEGSLAMPCYVINNYIEDGTNDTWGISRPVLAYRNIMSLNTTVRKGIYLLNGAAINNSIYNAGACTVSAIQNEGLAPVPAILNNLIEGYSGTGGIAIGMSANSSTYMHGGNAFYNCSTGFEAEANHRIDGGAAGTDTNETSALGASPFTTGGSDFSPVDTGAVKEGSIPEGFGGQ